MNHLAVEGRVEWSCFRRADQRGGINVHRRHLHIGQKPGAVVKDGPADRAGIKDKDVITKIGNIEVGHAGSISTLVGEYKVGETIQVTLIRDGKEKVVNVTLEAYDN